MRELTDLVGRYHRRALPVEDVLRRADLVSEARLRVGQLPGGRRRFLSFALAVVGDPELLFLDGPTSALDVAARQAFWLQMRELAGGGRTVLFATHQLDEADHLPAGWVRSSPLGLELGVLAVWTWCARP